MTDPLNVVVAASGLVIAGLGAVGLARPSLLTTLVDRVWKTPAGLYAAIVFRTVFGLVLIAAASDTRFPRVIGVLGVLTLITAIMIPMLGFVRLRRFVEWWLVRPAGYVRAWGVIACAFGVFLIYAVL